MTNKQFPQSQNAWSKKQRVEGGVMLLTVYFVVPENEILLPPQPLGLCWFRGQRRSAFTREHNNGPIKLEVELMMW